LPPVEIIDVLRASASTTFLGFRFGLVTAYASFFTSAGSWGRGGTVFALFELVLTVFEFFRHSPLHQGCRAWDR
jgi:hypothetical protein